MRSLLIGALALFLGLGSTADPIEHLTQESAKKLKVSELKRILAERGIECEGCAEKSDFIQRALEVFDRPKIVKPTPVPPPPPGMENIMKQFEGMQERNKRLRKKLQERGYDPSLADQMNFSGPDMDDDAAVDFLIKISGTFKNSKYTKAKEPTDAGREEGRRMNDRNGSSRAPSSAGDEASPSPSTSDSAADDGSTEPRTPQADKAESLDSQWEGMKETLGKAASDAQAERARARFDPRAVDEQEEYDTTGSRKAGQQTKGKAGQKDGEPAKTSPSSTAKSRKGSSQPSPTSQSGSTGSGTKGSSGSSGSKATKKPEPTPWKPKYQDSTPKPSPTVKPRASTKPSKRGSGSGSGSGRSGSRSGAGGDEQHWHRASEPQARADGRDPREDEHIEL